jgi:hypothetical protein
VPPTSIGTTLPSSDEPGAYPTARQLVPLVHAAPVSRSSPETSRSGPAVPFEMGAGLLEGLCAVGDDTEGVAWRVDAVVFLGEVEVPVGVEVAVADQGA